MLGKKFNYDGNILKIKQLLLLRHSVSKWNQHSFDKTRSFIATIKQQNTTKKVYLNMYKN